MVFITVWLLGDFFNIFGAVLQGVLPTMIILAVYYTLADIVLLIQCFWYKGFTLSDEIKHPNENGSHAEGSVPTEQSPLISNTRDRSNGTQSNGHGNGYHTPPRHGNGQQTPPRISDADRRYSTHSHHSFRERLFSIDGTHLSPATPLLDDANPMDTARPPRRQQSQSVAQTVFFNLGTVILVCASGVFGWWLSTRRSAENPRPPSDSEPEPLVFNLWGQIFGYICAVLYLGSRIPQLLLNYRRKSTDGISMLFFLFACIGNLTYVLSILAYKPVCKLAGQCEKDEASSIYGKYIAVNFSWLLGSFGTLVLDACVFVQYFLYRVDDDSSDEEESGGT